MIESVHLTLGFDKMGFPLYAAVYLCLSESNTQWSKKYKVSLHMYIMKTYKPMEYNKGSP